MEKHICLICAGSNTDKYRNLMQARKELKQMFPDILFGKEKETSPLFISNPSLFLNQIGCFTTVLCVEKIVSLLKEIEKIAGRKIQDKKKEIIKLDIDLLAYDDKILKPHELTRKYMADGIKELQGLLLPDPRYVRYISLLNSFLKNF